MHAFLSIFPPRRGYKFYDESMAKIFAVPRFYETRNRSPEPEDFGFPKGEARMNANNVSRRNVSRSCACTTNMENDGAPNRWKKKKKKGGSKSWQGCQKFDFLRGLKYLEDIISVFEVEILHLKCWYNFFNIW